MEKIDIMIVGMLIISVTLIVLMMLILKHCRTIMTDDEVVDRIIRKATDSKMRNTHFVFYFSKLFLLEDVSSLIVKLESKAYSKEDLLPEARDIHRRISRLH